MKTFKTAAALHRYLEANAVKVASVTLRPGESVEEARARLDSLAATTRLLAGNVEDSIARTAPVVTSRPLADGEIPESWTRAAADYEAELAWNEQVTKSRMR